MAVCCDSTLDRVKEYYGKILQRTSDLKTSACCSTESLPPRHRAILADLEAEILDKFYGCGSPLPPALEGCTVLDLGCGSGRDVYLAAKLVGPHGKAIGVDMTDEQLAVARRHVSAQTRRFGYDRPNVDFRQGYIEDLAGAGIEDNSVDVVISNCVINLSPNKERVFSEIFRVLKPGGEMFVADVYADRRLPESVRQDPVLYGECLGGALYENDFRRVLFKAGCPDARVVKRREITVDNPEFADRLGNARFFSITHRAFKLLSLEDACEDFGQVAAYLGSIEDHPHGFTLDDHHFLETGRPMLVCGNTAAMLEETRYAPHFRIDGTRAVHFGLFGCKEIVGGSMNGGCC